MGWRECRWTASLLTAANEDLVGTVLVTELGCIALPRFLSQATRIRNPPYSHSQILDDERRYASCRIKTHEFDGDLLAVKQIGAFKNDTKRPLSDLLAHSVVYADNVGRGGSHREFLASATNTTDFENESSPRERKPDGIWPLTGVVACLGNQSFYIDRLGG